MQQKAGRPKPDFKVVGISREQYERLRSLVLSPNFFSGEQDRGEDVSRYMAPCEELVAAQSKGKLNGNRRKWVNRKVRKVGMLG